MPLAPALARRSVCDLETVGRTSGLPRVIEIWFAEDPEHDRIYVLSGGRDRAHWVRNIRHDPTVRVRIGERWLAGRGRVVGPGPEDLEARRLVAAKYEDWREGRSLSSWARTSLPVAVELEVSTDWGRTDSGRTATAEMGHRSPEEMPPDPIHDGWGLRLCWHRRIPQAPPGASGRRSIGERPGS